MKLLNRLLRGLPCSYPRWLGRGGSNGAGLAAGAGAWRRKHREACDECRLQERRERQYLERLRGAAVPVASDDLTARLLARTEELAREARPAAGHPAGDPPSLQPGTVQGGTQHGGRVRSGVPARPRLAALSAGGAAAAVALMTGSAYLMGGSPAPLAGSEISSAFPQKDLRVSAAAGTPEAGTASGWGLTVEPDITPADALTAGQLTALRAQGWSCPELRELGFHLVWARGGVAAGGDMVELRLTDGHHFTTVLEQHARQPSQHGGSGFQHTPDAPPVNVLTGRSAAADGFTAAAGAEGTALPAGTLPETLSGEGSGGLWINAAPPFRAIYQDSAGATLTYVSDQPAAEAADGLAALIRASAPQRAETRAADGTAPDDATGSEVFLEGIRARIERGLGRIPELLAP
ncbi:hypothetical protein [Arthrobacter sp. V1I7]|uniref:hypothetical protein n=1 Tax=Arthrobacter sp. V1I7 TaxID=3042274 RepID=UPI0027D89E2C|nr:hypothetical protein [Arthrobacter sp. V1I7]